uniref:ACOX domain-containing protein n=1 Tax=Globodera pallida TaxID=36090 RepID=A0A183CIW5_GLOPA
MFQDSFMSAQQMEYVRIKMYDSLQRIRPIALTVVDSFDFTDAELKSVLGRRDGNVYEHLLEWAKQSPINANDVLPFHEKYLGSFMKEVREEREMSKI